MTWSDAFAFPYAVIPASAVGGVLVLLLVVAAGRWLVSLLRSVLRGF